MLPQAASVPALPQLLPWRSAAAAAALYKVGAPQPAALAGLTAAAGRSERSSWAAHPGSSGLGRAGRRHQCLGLTNLEFFTSSSASR